MGKSGSEGAAVTGDILTTVFYHDRQTGELVRRDEYRDPAICMDVILAVVNLRQRRTVVVDADDADEVLSTLKEWEAQP